MSTIQSIPAEVTRAQFARLRRMDMSYVCRLAKKGRLVLTADGKRVKVAESIALLGATEDPTKDGVRERFAEERGEAQLPLGAGTDLNASGEEPGDGAVPRGSTAEVRRELLQEQLEALKLRREKEAGRLVDAEEVRKAMFEKARVARNALFGLIDVVASRIAAETNPAKVAEILTVEFRRICEELAAGETAPTRQ